MSVAREAGGTRVRWREVIAGASYRVQFNDTLGASWQSVGGAPLPADPNGIVEYLDPSTPAPDQRFYRLVTLP